MRNIGIQTEFEPFQSTIMNFTAGQLYKESLTSAFDVAFPCAAGRARAIKKDAGILCRQHSSSPAESDG